MCSYEVNQHLIGLKLDSVSINKPHFPRNTSHIFHVETTWKQPIVAFVGLLEYEFFVNYVSTVKSTN